MHGFFNVNKPEGKTSHAVVAAVRKFSGIQRVGHGGTLDPIATGVLLICIGQGVRVSEYLLDHDKKYRARVRLGIETDTYDSTGTILSQHQVSLTRDEIESALKSFVGKISQYPPAYSAIKRDGVALYKLARQGITVETEARDVEIFSIEFRPPADSNPVVGSIQWTEIEFDVHCSKGTYIRSLAHDLGEKLGCGAHLSALTRLASGQFELKDSVTPEVLGEAFAKRNAEQYLIPLERALGQFDAVNVDLGTANKIMSGQPFDVVGSVLTPLVRVYTDGRIVALAEPSGAPNLWKPKKVFVIQ
jgi:tRNA pseudouridine55 synthase